MMELTVVIPLVVGLAVGYWWKSLLVIAFMSMLIVGVVIYGGGGDVDITQVVTDLTMVGGNWIEHHLKESGLFLGSFVLGAIVRS